MDDLEGGVRSLTRAKRSLGKPHSAGSISKVRALILIGEQSAWLIIRSRRVLGCIAAIVILLLLVALRIIEAPAARCRIARHVRAAVGRVDVIGVRLGLRRDLAGRD